MHKKKQRYYTLILGLLLITTSIITIIGTSSLKEQNAHLKNRDLDSQQINEDIPELEDYDTIIYNSIFNNINNNQLSNNQKNELSTGPGFTENDDNPIPFRRQEDIEKPISYLPLNGTLQDMVTGEQLTFTRDSVAFMKNGTMVDPNEPIVEIFAADYGRSIEVITPNVQDIQAFGSYNNTLYGFHRETGRVYTSNDGYNWSLDAELPGDIMSLFITNNGTILLSVGYNGNSKIYRRSIDGEYVHVLDLETAKAMRRNWIDTGSYIFVCEYGPLMPPNARRIYRSEDDGRTWELVYDPEYRHTHIHRILWDPYNEQILTTMGDGITSQLLITSDDYGDTWQVKPLYYPTPPSLTGGPTAGIVRPDGIYFGLDGGGVSGIYRQTRESNLWETVLDAGNTVPYRDDQINGNVYDMFDHNGTMFSPIKIVKFTTPNILPSLYTSKDGEHWALVIRFGAYQGGLNGFGGICNDKLYAVYQTTSTTTNLKLLSISLEDNAYNLINGTRFNGATTNLWNTSFMSSMEDSLDGWSSFSGASFEIDTNRSWHGQQSVHVTCKEAQRAGVCLPTCYGNFSTGDTISTLVNVYGLPRSLRLEIYNSEGSFLKYSYFYRMSQRWSQAFCNAKLTSDTDSLTVKLRHMDKTPFLDFWIDGIMISKTPGPQNWQIGGQPRMADHIVYDFDFPMTWTDQFLWVPDFGTDGFHSGSRILKVYEADDGTTLSVVYDPDDNVMRLIDSSNPGDTVETPPFLLASNAVVKIGVIQSVTSRTLFVQIAENPFVGSAEAAPLGIIRMHIGSDENHQNACGGLQARHRLFNMVAEIDQLEQLFADLIQSSE